MKRSFIITLSSVAALMISGCSKSSSENGKVGSADPTAPAAKTIAAEEAQFPPSAELKPVVANSGAPAKAEGIAEARQNAKDGEIITVSGRVKDFVNGKAMFTMVDSNIPSCEETMPGEPEPWDYCCTPKSELVKNMATVKIVKEGSDEALPGNIEGVNALDHLTTVVVEGRASRDNGGNLIVAATKVYTNSKPR